MSSYLDASVFSFGGGFHALHLREAMTMLSSAYEILANELTYTHYNENKLRDDLVRYVPPKREGVLMSFDTESRNLDLDNVRIDITIVTLQVLCEPDDDFEKRITIECKIIGVDQYINRNGIISYVEGKYASHLPVAGMIGFIFGNEPETIKERINFKLKKHKKIYTLQFLQPYLLDNNFSNSYTSKHNRDNSLPPIEIYHLLLNYTALAV